MLLVGFRLVLSAAGAVARHADYMVTSSTVELARQAALESELRRRAWAAVRCTSRWKNPGDFKARSAGVHLEYM
jgi:hypothetical protein